ncbi:MAG: hypothetical protein F7C32_00055 [Desulfurococcales archaeon]|nr:hypothetical protein [Desulfurococcales archaeon]
MSVPSVKLILPFSIVSVMLENGDERTYYVETHFSSLYKGKTEFLAFVLPKDPGITRNPGVGVIAKQVLSNEEIFSSLVDAFDVIPKSAELAVKFSIKDAIKESFRALFLGGSRGGAKVSSRGVLVGSLIFLVRDVLRMTSRPARLDVIGNGWLGVLFERGIGFRNLEGLETGFPRVLNWLYKRDDVFRMELRRILGSV